MQTIEQMGPPYLRALLQVPVQRKSFPSIPCKIASSTYTVQSNTPSVFATSRLFLRTAKQSVLICIVVPFREANDFVLFGRVSERGLKLRFLWSVLY